MISLVKDVYCQPGLLLLLCAKPRIPEYSYELFLQRYYLLILAVRSGQKSYHRREY